MNSILIDGGYLFSKYLAKYKKFRKEIRRRDLFIMNTLAMYFDYMFYCMTHLQKLVQKYVKVVIYYNVNKVFIHMRKDLKGRSVERKKWIKRAFSYYRRVIFLSKEREEWEEFAKIFKGRKVPEGSGYDYDNECPRLIRSFLYSLYNITCRMDNTVLHSIHMNILAMLRNVKVVYTRCQGIDYSAYHLFRFIRPRCWRDTSFKEKREYDVCIPKIYESVRRSNMCPVFDVAESNSYDTFTSNTPKEMYLCGKCINYLDDDFIDEDFRDVGELSYMDARRLYEVVTSSWGKFFPLYDLKRIKL